MRKTRHLKFIIAAGLLAVVAFAYQNCGKSGMLVLHTEPANNPSYAPPGSSSKSSSSTSSVPSKNFAETGGPALIHVSMTRSRTSSGSASNNNAPRSNNSNSHSGGRGAYCPNTYHSCDECLDANGYGLNSSGNPITVICVDKRRSAGPECDKNLTKPECQCWNEISPGEGPNSDGQGPSNYNWRHLGYAAGDYNSGRKADSDNIVLEGIPIDQINPAHFHPRYHCLWLRSQARLDEVRAEVIRNRPNPNPNNPNCPGACTVGVTRTENCTNGGVGQVTFTCVRPNPNACPFEQATEDCSDPPL